MSIIKEIRDLTGLSHEKLAAWLGVSKSLVQFAEKGERMLRGDASKKLTLLTLPVQQLKKAMTTTRHRGAMLYTDPAALARQHKKKLLHHLAAAGKQQQQLKKLESLHLKLTARLVLLDIMNNLDTELYRASKLDKHIAGLLEFFGRDRMAAAFKKQEQLQERIQVHLAYAEVHKLAWEGFQALKK
jgi:DNA-binding XRE family transcriptional regulator